MRAMPGQVTRRLAPFAALAVLLAAAAPARAQEEGGQEAPAPDAATPDYFGAAAEPMTFQVDRPRSKEAKILMASLFGGAVVFAGAGLLFHLHARGQADEVSTRTDRHTGKVYTEELDATRRDAVRAGRLAAGGYAIGGGFLIATFVAYLITDPGTETIRVGEAEETPAPAPSGRPHVQLEAAEGGGLVGAWWSF
jgi:hypothetical protein